MQPKIIMLYLCLPCTGSETGGGLIEMDSCNYNKEFDSHTDEEFDELLGVYSKGYCRGV